MDLHAQIMNLPCRINVETHPDNVRWYKSGHRDARHAAAELALTAGTCLSDYEGALLGYLESQKFAIPDSEALSDYRDGFNRALQVVIDRVRLEREMRSS